jgi:hypothetical protein
MKANDSATNPVAATSAANSEIFKIFLHSILFYTIFAAQDNILQKK